MKRNFIELQKFLERRYPQLIGNMHAETYPPNPTAVVLVQCTGILQLATIAMLLLGEGLFKLVGMPAAPEWYKSVEQNKISTFAGVWILNSFAAQGVATGAFEVLLDGDVAFSKLESGHMPSAEDIVRGLEALGMIGPAGAAAAALDGAAAPPQPAVAA